MGGIALARTIRKDFYVIRTSEEEVTVAVKQAITNFPSEFEQLIPHERRMNTLLYYATGIFNSNHVIWGKEDWLFYSSTNSGDPIADYTGANSYSDGDLELAKENMLNMQNALQAKGMQFCLLIPPNKENVYAQYMPDKYRHAETTRTDALVDYLSENGVNAVNPKEALMACKEPYRTYFKLDTHWNELGAYIGISETLKTLGIDLPEANADNIEEGTDTVSDLADMVGLTSVFPPDYGFRMSSAIADDNDLIQEEIGSITHWQNENAPIQKSVFVIGDSFRSAMIPDLKALCSDFYVVYRGDYQPEMLDTVNADIVVLEIVERHSASTMEFSLVD